jgi:Transglycosylase SLT domain
MTTNMVGAASAVVGAIVGVTTAMTAMVDKVIQADLQYQKMALQMHTSVDVAKNVQKALDALGASLDEIYWIPEQGERFNKLLADSEKMASSSAFKQQAQYLRDVRFEFTRLYNIGTFVIEKIAYYLTKIFGGSIKELQGGLKGFNDWLIKNIDYVASKIADKIGDIIKVFFDIVDAVKLFFKTLSGPELKNFLELITALFLIFNPMYALVLGIVWAFDDLMKYLTTGDSKVGSIWEYVISLFDFFHDVLIDILDCFGELSEDANSLGELFKDTFNVTFLEAFRGALKSIEVVIKAVLSQAINDLGTIGKLVWQLLHGDFKGMGRTISQDRENSLKIEKDFKNNWNNIDWHNSTSNARKYKNSSVQQGNLSGSSFSKSSSPTGGGIDAYISEASQKFGVPEDVIRAVIAQESSGDPNAISSAGAIGLMQLMPETAAELGVNPYDPRENVMGGTKYLAQMYAGEGNWPDAFRAYNGGPGWRTSGAAGTEENRNYASGVLGHMGSALSTAQSNYYEAAGGQGATSYSQGASQIDNSIGTVTVTVTGGNVSKDDVYAATLDAIRAERKLNTTLSQRSLLGVGG